MPDLPKEGVDTPNLSGTTLRVYRYMLKQSKAMGISEVQKGLGLSSPSLAQYHIRKLLALGLIKEEGGGYVVDRVVVENFVRIRKISIPVQTAYVVFFGATLFILLVFFWPRASVYAVYFLAVVINAVALGVSIYEMMKTLRHL